MKAFFFFFGQGNESLSWKKKEKKACGGLPRRLGLRFESKTGWGEKCECVEIREKRERMAKLSEAAKSFL